MAEPTQAEIDAVAAKIPESEITARFCSVMAARPDHFRTVIEDFAQEFDTDPIVTGALVMQVLGKLEDYV